MESPKVCVQRTAGLEQCVNYDCGDKNENSRSEFEAQSVADAILGEILTTFDRRQGPVTANVTANQHPNRLTYVRNARNQAGTGRRSPLIEPLLRVNPEDVQRSTLRDMLQAGGFGHGRRADGTELVRKIKSSHRGKANPATDA